jgi:hypothetical protein
MNTDLDREDRMLDRGKPRSGEHLVRGLGARIGNPQPRLAERQERRRLEIFARFCAFEDREGVELEPRLVGIHIQR